MVDIKSMTLEELTAWLKDQGEAGVPGGRDH